MVNGKTETSMTVEVGVKIGGEEVVGCCLFAWRGREMRGGRVW